MSSDSDTDWFDKDEDQLVNEIKKNRNTTTDENSTTEYFTIKDPPPKIREVANTNYRYKVSTVELRNIVAMNPLDAFLRIATQEDLNYFLTEITQNDSNDRVILCLRCLSIVCDLELPIFHGEMLRSFSSNEPLLSRCRELMQKVFATKRLDKFWTEEKVDGFIDDIHKLLLAAYSNGFLRSPPINTKLNVLRYMHELIMETKNVEIAKRQSIIDFRNSLNSIIAECNTNDPEICNACVLPTFEELLHDERLRNTAENVDENIPHCVELQQYIQILRTKQRESFVEPLKIVIGKLKEENEPPRFVDNTIIYTGVTIVVNEDFLGTYRHQMVYLDFLSQHRNGKKHIDTSELLTLKTGTLFCLTTSCEFDNLILARVTYTDGDMIIKSYVGIEICRQYNIGNIYNKEFIAFETPAFFEAFYHVDKYLSSTFAHKLPMQDYIVSSKVDVKPPAYLTAETTYTLSDKKNVVPLQLDSFRYKDLNPSQCQGLIDAFTRELSIIQGPPGTGKTHFSVELIINLIANVPRVPIIILTYTNASLDKLLLKLSKHTEKILRFGSQTRLQQIERFNVRNVISSTNTNPHLKRLYYITNQQFNEYFARLKVLHTEFDGSEESYQEIVKAQEDLNIVQEKLNCIRTLFQYYAAVECDGVIAMTTTCGAKLNFLFRLLKSAIVVFEEAAEILESHVISCLTPYTQHVIMIGDHMQLRPFVMEHDDVQISLFERLIKNGIPFTTFDTQYRMRPCIADLLCPHFYERLHHGDNVKKYPPLVKGMLKNIYFLTHSEPEITSERNSSICNLHEVRVIIHLIDHLIRKAHHKPTNVVVLSPYNLQVDMIQKELKKKKDGIEMVRVFTVDSFQGLEADIIILSLVRNKRIGFLKDKNRICVALSRAKHGLYILGNMDLLSEHSEIWRHIKYELFAQEAIGSGSFPLTEELVL